MPYTTDPDTGHPVWSGDSTPTASQTSIRRLLASMQEQIDDLEESSPQLRSVSGTLTTADSSLVITVLDGETLFGAPVIETSGGGVTVESVTQSGTSVTIAFTGTPNVDLAITIRVSA